MIIYSRKNWTGNRTVAVTIARSVLTQFLASTLGDRAILSTKPKCVCHSPRPWLGFRSNQTQFPSLLVGRNGSSLLNLAVHGAIGVMASGWGCGCLRNFHPRDRRSPRLMSRLIKSGSLDLWRRQKKPLFFEP